jgi:hypothetical protein
LPVASGFVSKASTLHKHILFLGIFFHQIVLVFLFKFFRGDAVAGFVQSANYLWTSAGAVYKLETTLGDVKSVCEPEPDLTLQPNERQLFTLPFFVWTKERI